MGLIFTQAALRSVALFFGVYLIVAGVLCPDNPFGTLICIITAFALFRRGTRATLVLTGLASFVLGLVVILLPGSAIVGFLFVAAIFLVVIGVVGIVSLASSRSQQT